MQSLLKPFAKVTVLYGHVHQIQYNQIGNISFNSTMATAWPWPYPTAYRQGEVYLPKLTVPMNRADPFHERDGTGWQFVNLASGNVDVQYTLYDNRHRAVVFNPKTGAGRRIASIRTPGNAFRPKPIIKGKGDEGGRVVHPADGSSRLCGGG